MDKNERNIFIDIPAVKKDGSFHSAVLTTFSIDLVHFDNFFLNLLSRKKICSINVFTDLNQMAEAMEWVNPSIIGNAGKKYSLTNIESRGAFHPKISFFVGDDTVMAIIGSGNLTVAGHGKNHEAFTGFMIDQNDDRQRPLIEECWHYIKSIAKRGTDFDKKRILHEIPENCSLLINNNQVQPHSVHQVKDDLEAALLYNDETSGILKQLSQIIPMREVQAITVVSPFFDEQGTTLTSLAQLCPDAKLDVLFQRKCQIPPCNMEKHNRICFYDFDSTTRGKKNYNTYQRLVHAKIFHFKTANKEYCMIGSANATIAGVGTDNNRGVNEEMCVLYISEGIKFLTTLGIKHNREKIAVPQKALNKGSQDSSTTRFRHKLFTAQYLDDSLRLCCDIISENEEIYIAVDNGEETDYVLIDEFKHDLLIAKHSIKNSIKNKVIMCYLVDDKYKCISNKVFVNIVKMLEEKNPSKESRSINSIISQIENDGYNGLEISEILTDLMVGMVDQDSISQEVVHSSSNSTKEKDESLPVFQYNADYDNNQTSKKGSVFKDRSSRLIECIEDSIRRKIKEIDKSLEEQMDEEEEGNAESSYKRESQSNYTRTIKEKNINSIAQVSTSALNKYMKLVEKRQLQQEHTNNHYLTADDLNYFSIFIFASLEICVLNRWNYYFEGIDSITISSLQKKLYSCLDNSIYNEGAKAFQKFVSFCEQSKIPTMGQFAAIARRTVKYAVLYGTLFLRKATDYHQQAYGKQIINGTKKLFSILGTPSMEYLEAELAPLSERYNYEFRMAHIEMFVKNVLN